MGSKIYDEYFKYTNEYTSIYGEKTVILMQVGSFFEIYGYKCDNIIKSSKIEDVSDVCQFSVVERKNVTYFEGTIVMAGFNCYSLDKYLTKLTDAGYTVPVITQEKKGDGFIRSLYNIYSPGTFVSCETDSDSKISNNVMCIWFELHKSFRGGGNDILIYGASVIDIYTGKSSIFQHETSFTIDVTTFDELERYVSIYNPNEVLIISPFDDNTIQTIKQYSGIHDNCLHIITDKEKIKRCSSQRYIKEILSYYFEDDTYDVCQEFKEYNTATQSYCFLLNFVREHNTDLTRKIYIPDFNNISNRVVLANHTLLQLNIINDSSIDSKKVGNLSSVLSLLNCCCSPMGKRNFKNQMANPTYNVEWLENEYNMISIMLETKNYELVANFRKQISKLRDIDKLCRQIIIKKIYPSSIYHLYNTINSIQQLNTCLYESNEICDYLCNDFDTNGVSKNDYIDNLCSNVSLLLTNNFIMDECKLINSMTTFNENIICSGISNELDNALEEYKKCQKQLGLIRDFFHNLLESNEEKKNSKKIEYIKIHETEKSGCCLQLTKKRAATLKSILKKIPKSNTNVKIEEDTFSISDIKLNDSLPGSNTVIEFELLNNVCSTILFYKNELNKIIAKTYIEILSNFEDKFIVSLEEISQYTAKLDVLLNKSYISNKYNYCRPVIDNDNSKKSYLDAYDIRHALIEHLQQNELYVANDISLGHVNSSKDGILLYGTNAVGKTSLIRSVGVTVIMAQVGMFVPCSKFVYKPYTAIYSRILGNDNIFKGLSTFAVEISELRTILKMADENSLILGDELCSGTEIISALSIFATGLIELSKKQSSYIFATHLHQLVDYDEINSLERLSMMHMKVTYDHESELLIYDRKLIDGTGPNSYGLEVCKSLYLGNEFINSAYEMRNKYFPNNKGHLSFNNSRYNSDKLKGMCEMCGEHMGEEIHHLQQQKDADSNGFIGSINKDHKANLMSVCSICHDKIHSTRSKKKVVRKKTTKGMKVLQE
jgi:DNA mismatch repair protein MutS